MGTLVVFNLALIAVITVALVAVKKTVKSERGQNAVLICAASLTIFCHYSSFLYRLVTGGDFMSYLQNNPNLILPIYPCNVGMWTALIFACLKNKRSKLGTFLADYLFWFGIFSTLVGMFANVDFIKNPTLADYEILKSILAHATLLFNVLLIPLFGHIRIDFGRNMRHILYSIVEMLVIGLYCNLLFRVLVSEEMAYEVNSMFLIHSPFDALPFLTYPIISLIAAVLYFALFAILERIFLKREDRFFTRHAVARKGT